MYIGNIIIVSANILNIYYVGGCQGENIKEPWLRGDHWDEPGD